MTNGIDLTAGMKVNAIKELGKKIDELNNNLSKQNKIQTNLTKAIYFLSGVSILLIIIQIFVGKNIL